MRPFSARAPCHDQHLVLHPMPFDTASRSANAATTGSNTSVGTSACHIPTPTCKVLTADRGLRPSIVVAAGLGGALRGVLVPCMLVPSVLLVVEHAVHHHAAPCARHLPRGPVSSVRQCSDFGNELSGTVIDSSALVAVN